MSMSDVVSSMNMTIFPIVGLVIFVVLFLVVVVRAMRTSSFESRDAASIPLADEVAPSATSTPAARR